ncbi:ABC transporter ATP-binding protein [Nocardiopsis synnemataformans]|uniref:ABC transporter ATP-binding protein n=1 Tax=Nocardiopsis synnemataformans TaxID=61305 RepID=UPI003EB6C4B0
MRTPASTSEPAEHTDDAEGLSLPELTASKYYHFEEKAAQASWATIARRMPTLMRHAIALAWKSSPRDVVATTGFNIGVGAATAWALVSTTTVLDQLFAAVPTPERVVAALPALVWLAAALVSRGVCSALAGRAQARLEPQVVVTAEGRFMEDATRVELAAFDDSDFHDHLFRCYLRGCNEAGALVRHTTDVLTGLVGVVAAAGVLGALHPVLVPVLLLAMVPQWWGAASAARLRYRMMLASTEGRRRKFMIEQLMIGRGTAAEVRSYTMAPRLMHEFAKVARYELDIHLRLATRMAAIRLSGDTLSGLVTALVFVLLGVLLVQGVVPIATAGAAVVAIRVAQGALSAALSSVAHVYESGLYFSDFLAFTESAQRRLPRPGLPAAPTSFEEIVVDDITFAYPRGQEETGEERAPALSGVSLTLGRGQTIALVGENGSGKTTLAKLLSGLYTPQQGRVRWDGIDVAEVDGDSLRERIAVIAQDHTHWPLTARGNVVMSSPGNDPERLEDAARASQADTVVSGLSQGWDTLLDKRFAQGYEPSGGQWQRLAAARGFYRCGDGEHVPLLIADEPTAALDARAEHAFFASVHSHAARTGATVVLITHRLASVRMADHIVVLDQGRVIEQGSHEELMEAAGQYRELWELQASAYQDLDSTGHVA